MLCQLYIENLAVIEKASIDFQEGMTVFTGETGAGKVDRHRRLKRLPRPADRPGNRPRRSGQEGGRSSPPFPRYPSKRCGKSSGRTVTDRRKGSLLVVQREIYRPTAAAPSGIGGRPATVSLLREIGQYLINIHGQHDNQQSPLRPSGT